MKLTVCTFLLTVVFNGASNVQGEKNLQAWSHSAYTKDAINLTCNHNFTNAEVQGWYKRGSNDEIQGDDNFQLLPSDDGVTNAILRIENVTDDMEGFYICLIKDTDSQNVESVLQGLNIGPFRRYKDKFERYETDIYRGLIASASVAFVVLSVGIMSAFRYLTDEQKAKRRFRKSLRNGPNGTAHRSVKVKGTEVEIEESGGVTYYNGSFHDMSY